MKIKIKGVEVAFTQTRQEDYICITDIAKFKNPEAPRDIIKNWMRSKNTIELLGLWKRLNNSDFKQVEFDLFKIIKCYLFSSKVKIYNNYFLSYYFSSVAII